MTAALAITGLRKGFARRSVLSDLNLTVQAHEVVAVRGPNGAGKSTLLGCVVGTVIPDAGTIRIGGVSLHDQPMEARQLLRYVPQEADLPHGVTGRELLDLLGATYQALAHVDQAAALTGLGDALPRLASAYSVGMRRRLQLGVLALGDPALLVLDEPFAGLDAAGRAGLLDAVRAARDRGAGVLVAAHDLDWDALGPVTPREVTLTAPAPPTSSQ